MDQNKNSDQQQAPGPIEQYEKKPEEPPIRVINGEAKPSRGIFKKIVFTFIALVLLAGLGGTGYLYAKEKSDKQKLKAEANSMQAKIREQTESINELNNKLNKNSQSDSANLSFVGWKNYKSNDSAINFFYPAKWSLAKEKSSSVGKYESNESVKIENTDTKTPEASPQFLFQSFKNTKVNDLFTILKSKSYWNDKCKEYSSIIDAKLVSALSCGPELVNGNALTNYYAYTSDSGVTYLFSNDQMAGKNGPQINSLVYQGILNSLELK